MIKKSNSCVDELLVSVAMCTYKRLHLTETLKSVAGMNIPTGVKMEIVVVDNDPDKSALNIVNDFQKGFPNTVVSYISEPRKNISLARNACLNNSKGSWIAFIDDDEVADKNWLGNLLCAAREFNADVVVGYVESIFPKHTPDWVIDGKFFDRKRLPTGTEIDSCGAGCTLIKVEAIGSQKFNLEYGLSGGEDSEFFYGMHNRGKKIIYCSEALVYEKVEKNRVCFKFLWQRRFRIGMSFSKYRYKDVGPINKVLFFLKNVFQLVFLCLLLLVFVFFSKHRRYAVLLYIADRLGKIKYLFSNEINKVY
jgi:succinoglycan biosynthesis protein ExoM